jgi:Flp pilus assembly pilin Flp
MNRRADVSLSPLLPERRLAQMRCAHSVMVRLLTSFSTQQQGATLVEYGVMLGFIAVVAAGAVVAVGTVNNSMLMTAAAAVQP